MKITYVADDGTVFDSPDKCLAYEEKDEERFKEWEQMLIDRDLEDVSKESLLRFLGRIEGGDIAFFDKIDFWTYRRKLIELAKSFEEVAEKTD